MYIFDFLPPQFYHYIYTLGLLSLCLIVIFIYVSSNNNNRIATINSADKIGSVLFTLLLIAFIGLRPIAGFFGDMGLYAYTYNNFDSSFEENMSQNGEWLFIWIIKTCKSFNFEDRIYFLAISTIYFGFMAMTCWRLMRNNMFVAIMFCAISFSCYTYGVNGIRNGMATSIMMFAMSFIKDKNKWMIILSLIIMYLSISIHKAMMLPAVCALSACFFVKDPKIAIVFWIVSVLISFVAGNYVTQFFVNLGFDDRMEQYANLENQMNGGVAGGLASGFRFDFILYSIMPIVMTWYVTIKRNFRDRMYNIIAITYILANAFWIMVIRSEQSNRFAYLSWFLYPLVIAYPLLRMNLWEDQDRKLGLFLLAYSGFTVFMEIVYYG